MIEIQPKDSRAYFMLPQSPEGAGYYVYGTPDRGAGQYAHPLMMSVLFFVEREWQAGDHRQFGIGNISLAGGACLTRMKVTRMAFRWMCGRYASTAVGSR